MACHHLGRPPERRPFAATGGHGRPRARQRDGTLSVLGGIFDGDQAGPGPDDPQLRDRYGVNFRVNDPPLLLGQLQYAWNNKKGDPNLSGQIKERGWRHFGDFPDQRYAANGVSLAAPTSSNDPLQLSGDIGAS